MTIIDWILDLFRNEDAARAFVAAPEQTLRDAGLAGISAAQMSTVAATAIPGMVLGGGDPVVGLQRAVSNHYGFAPAHDYSPSNSLLSPNTDFASHNNVPIMSPNQDAGANAQQGAFNLGFGDITLGDKTSNTATNGGVVVGGDNRGDIVSGDGAVLGNNNNVNNGDVWAGTGSNVAIGHSDIKDNGTINTGSGSVIKDNDGPVIHDVDASGGNGGSASGGGSLIGIGGGNAVGGHGGGGGIVSNDTATTATNTVGGNQTHVGGDSGIGNSLDASTYTVTSVVDNSDSSTHETSVYDNSSQHSASLVDNSHDFSLASGNQLLGF